MSARSESVCNKLIGSRLLSKETSKGRYLHHLCTQQLAQTPDVYTDSPKIKRRQAALEPSNRHISRSPTMPGSDISLLQIETTRTTEMEPLPSNSTAPKGSVAVFENLSFEVKNKNGVARLVEDVSVKVSQGQVRRAPHVSGTSTYALDARNPRPFVITTHNPCSPCSGAGKSTLLDLMSFRKKTMEGGNVSPKRARSNGPSAGYA